MATSSEETIELAVGAEKCSEVEPPSQSKSSEEDEEPEQDQNQNGENTSFCRVSVSYSSEMSTELQLEEGDIVEVLSKRSDGWWTGILRGKVGLFPSNFVIPVSADKVHKDDNLKYCKVLYDMITDMPDVLELRENDIIEVISKFSDGWWKGRCGNQVGMFPSNFVTMIPTPLTPSTSATISATTSTSSATSCSAGTELILSQCRVVVPFPGNDDDELTLQDGDIITIVSKDDSLWWKGVLHGKTGIFPKNFVREIPTATTNAAQTRNDDSRSLDVPVPVAEHSWQVEQNIEENLENTPLSFNLSDITEPVTVAVPEPTDNEVLPQCRVVAAYEGTEHDELTLVEGDVITIISKGGHWWRGTLNGKTGMFPKSFVEEESRPTQKHEEVDAGIKRLWEQEMMEKLRIEHEEKQKCVICMDCDINSAFFPCGHITCCADCAPKNDICPLCRVAIKRTERIYLPG